MQRFVADQRRRERDGLASLAVTGSNNKPSKVTTHTRCVVFNSARKVLRDALENGAADRLGMDREFIATLPTAGGYPQKARRPLTDEAARALADERNLEQLAQVHDPADHGLRDAWETIVTTGRRTSEVLKLRWDCLGRFGNLPMFWHDQTKVGNYDAAIRIPERLHDVLAERQRKTMEKFTARHGRNPTDTERAAMALFPGTTRNPNGARSLSYTFIRGFRQWVDELDLGRPVPHQARHSLATNLLRHGATLSHIRKYLGQVSDRMAEHYVHLAHSDLENVLQHVWVAGPGAANPGELLAGDTTHPSPEGKPKPWPSTSHAAALRPRADSAPSNRSSTAAPVPGIWTASTAINLSSRERISFTGGANASSGSSWPRAPRTTRPPTTCTATSSPPPAPSTAWRRLWPGSACSTTRSRWTCANPRTTSSACGPPPSARPTSPPLRTTRTTPLPRTPEKTAHEHVDRRRASHGRRAGRPPQQHAGGPRSRPRRDFPATQGKGPGQRRRRQSSRRGFSHVPLRKPRGAERGRGGHRGRRRAARPGAG
jgi:integrase